VQSLSKPGAAETFAAVAQFIEERLGTG
jgi:hypothetical protein